jgi:predicted Zn-dependent protease
MEWDDLKQTAYSILKKCRDVPFCEIRIEQVTAWSVVVEEKISKLYCINNEGINISLHSKDRHLSFFLPGDRVCDLESVLSQFLMHTGHPPPWIEKVEAEKHTFEFYEKFNPPEETLFMAEWTLQEIPLLQGEVYKINTIARSGFARKAYMNNIGGECETVHPFSEYNLSVRGGKIDFLYSGYLHRPPQKSQNMLDTVKTYAKTVCEALPHAKAMNPCTAPLVLDVMPFSIIVHELGHLLEYDFATQSCFTLNDIGNPVTSKAVTLRDIPSTAGFCIPFDDEGTAGRDALLIDKGVLRGFLVDRKTAHETTLEVKGNSRAETYMHSPMIRSRTTALDPGEYTMEELLEEADGGFYLYGAHAVDATPDGAFTIAIPLAYFIKKGELHTPFFGIQLSGNLFTFCSNIGAVAKESAFQISHCSKGFKTVQKVKVGTLCPAAFFTSWNVERGSL